MYRPRGIMLVRIGRLYRTCACARVHVRQVSHTSSGGERTNDVKADTPDVQAETPTAAAKVNDDDDGVGIPRTDSGRFGITLSDSGGDAVVDDTAFVHALGQHGIPTHRAERLLRLSHLVHERNRGVNLVSRKTGACADNILLRHIVPCIAPALIRGTNLDHRMNVRANVSERTAPRHMVQSSKMTARADNRARVLDVGTGGGFPGLPLAILCPHAHFTLLDSCKKKLDAVQTMADEIGLMNVEVLHERVERLRDTRHAEKFDIITGRFTTDLSSFVGLCAALLASHRRARIFYIGGGPVDAPIESFNLNHKLHAVNDVLGTQGLCTSNVVEIEGDMLRKWRRHNPAAYKALLRPAKKAKTNKRGVQHSPRSQWDTHDVSSESRRKRGAASGDGWHESDAARDGSKSDDVSFPLLDSGNYYG